MELFIGNVLVKLDEDLKEKTFRLVVRDRTSRHKVSFVVKDPKEITLRDADHLLRELKL